MMSMSKKILTIWTIFVGVFFVYSTAFGISSEFNVEIIGISQCADGIDNDGDSFIDFPDDNGGGSIADNNEADTPTGGGGGGGGVGGPGPRDVSITNVTISGQGYPNQPVTLLKDAQIVSTVIADQTGKFTVDVNDLSSGNYIFSLYSEDVNAIRSTLITFPLEVDKNFVTNISGAFIPPTIRTDKQIVEQGKTILLSGQTAPNAIVQLILVKPSGEEVLISAYSDSNGVYSYQFSTEGFGQGQYSLKSYASYQGRLSTLSTTITFEIGLADELRESDGGCAIYADLNEDCRVNLVDFSIAAFWYEQPISEEFAKKESEKLNGDGKINLTDFSIMAFYWTG